METRTSSLFYVSVSQVRNPEKRLIWKENMLAPSIYRMIICLVSTAKIMGKRVWNLISKKNSAKYNTYLAALNVQSILKKSDILNLEKVTVRGRFRDKVGKIFTILQVTHLTRVL